MQRVLVDLQKEKSSS